jgi:hypothetical protein
MSEKEADLVNPVVASEESGDIDDPENVAWANLFSINAMYQTEDISAGRYFEMYMGDATRPDESGFTRDVSVHAFLPDPSGRPQVLVLNVYLNNVHTQVFMGAAGWSDDGPSVVKLSSSEAFEYMPEAALNFQEVAEEATKIILRLESPIAGSGVEPAPTVNSRNGQYLN